MVLNRKIDRGELLDRLILEAVYSGRCTNVADVVNEVRTNDDSFTIDEIRPAIKHLEQENRLSYVSHSIPFPRFLAQSFLEPVFALRMSGVVLSLIVLALPDTGSWSFPRILGACISLLFSPGNALTELTFPAKFTDTLERIALSVSLSIVVVSLTTLIISFQLGHFSIEASVISLAIFTVSISILMKYRQFVKLKARRVVW